MIHQLQRERGVTCGLVGSGGGAYFIGLVAEHRSLTDTLAMDSATQATLLEIRAIADESSSYMTRGSVDIASDDSAAAATAVAFVTVFSRFNQLIQRTLDTAAERSPDIFEASIVEAFSRLKEATGVERAFLCGALALSPLALTHLPSRAFAELVMGLQQQRAHEAVIRETAPPKLLELIRAGFEYSPELREVQSRLLADFDVSRLRATLSADQCWRLMTEHIDKLERLQVLLHDELQKQRQSASTADATIREMARALSSDAGSGDASGVGERTLTQTADRVAAMPAPVLKREVMRMLNETKQALQLTVAGQTHQRRVGVDEEGDGEVGADVVADEDAELEPAATCDGELRGDHLLLLEMSRVVPEELRINLDELTFRRRIGSGAAGVTYLAVRAGSTVAVKLACGGGGVDDWRREVRALARLRHPNVVRCVGVICAPPSFGLVIEYCAGGDLSTALTQPTPPAFLGHVAQGVAAGMLHLHERAMLHRDLKGANVLLGAAAGELPAVKVSDFGLAAPAPDDTRTGGWLTAETGTYRFMAPEVVCHERYSKSADVYSFGCVLFELLTHEQPFADRTPLQAAVAVGLNQDRPALPGGVPTRLEALLNACWCHEPTERPTFACLHRELAGLPSLLTASEHAWLDAADGHPVYANTPSEVARAPDVNSGSARRSWLQSGREWMQKAIQALPGWLASPFTAVEPGL